MADDDQASVRANSWHIVSKSTTSIFLPTEYVPLAERIADYFTRTAISKHARWAGLGWKLMTAMVPLGVALSWFTGHLAYVSTSVLVVVGALFLVVVHGARLSRKRLLSEVDRHNKLEVEKALLACENEVNAERNTIANDRFSLSRWFAEKQEDEVVDIPKIISLEISQKDSHLEASVTLCPLHNGQSVSIANLVVGWKFSGDQPLWLPMFVGERVLNEIQEFKVNFPMVLNHVVSGARLVGFSVTKHHFRWKDWSGQVDT